MFVHVSESVSVILCAVCVYVFMYLCVFGRIHCCQNHSKQSEIRYTTQGFQCFTLKTHATENPSIDHFFQLNFFLVYT